MVVFRVIAKIFFNFVFGSYPTVLEFFSEGNVIILGGRRLCRHFPVHGKMI